MSNDLSFEAVKRKNSKLWDDITKKPFEYRVLTGERPTGALHIGHYFGTLKNRVLLQNLGVELFIVIADYQVLTDRDASAKIKENIKNIILDYLAIGLDPEKFSTLFFCHSYVKELNQLLLPFLSLFSTSELERNPTVKDEIKMAGMKQVNALMYTYPVHQAADILFCNANLVPGGKDQGPHLEAARTIARRFNTNYSPDKSYFKMPELLLSETPLILGLDGRKMGKSLNNSILLSHSEDDTAELIKKANTDSDKNIYYDPDKRPEVSNLLLIASQCLNKDPRDIADEIGNKGSKFLKELLIEAVNETFRNIRQKRILLSMDSDYVWFSLKEGNRKASEIASSTLEDVRKLMGMNYY